MRAFVLLFLSVAVVILAAWWWLGRPVVIGSTAASSQPYCVSYSPFRDGETPFDLSTRIDPVEIEQDLIKLRQVTECVRTYSTDFGLDRVAEVAARHQMKVIQGAWLGLDAVRNQREIATAIALAKRFPQTIQALVVGNEALLRGEISAADLAGVIRAVKAQVAVPVTYAEVWEFWLRYREVAEAVDFVTIHVLPYWEDFPVAAADAAAHLEAIRRKLIAAFPNKEILVGEVGWPSAGRMREGALPSPINQAQVITDVLSLAHHDNFRVNVIEAFDQPWKRYLEGTVGGHWGLLDGTSREPKFLPGMAVSNHPYWRMQAALGLGLSLLMLLAAAISCRREPPVKVLSAGQLAALFGCAAVPGSLIGWVVEAAGLEGFGGGGWARSAILVALAVLAPIGCAVAITRRIALPSFAQVFARAGDRPRDWLALGLGVVFAALAVVACETGLGLVFDPRYRDFPFAALSAAAVPFAMLSLINTAPTQRWGPAERAMAGVLALSAIYIALNESFANWQALWLCAGLLAVVFCLMRSRARQTENQ